MSKVLTGPHVCQQRPQVKSNGAGHGSNEVTCKASKVVNASLVIELEGATQALSPPPIALLLMCLHHASRLFGDTMTSHAYMHVTGTVKVCVCTSQTAEPPDNKESALFPV